MRSLATDHDTPRAPETLIPGRLGSLIARLAKDLRRAHCTPQEARYVYTRARRQAGIRGPSASGRRLPDYLTPVEIGRVLEAAYAGRNVQHGLIVRTLFETGVRVSELVGLEVPDVDWAERTMKVRQGKGGKDRFVVFTAVLGEPLRVMLAGRTRGALFESSRHRPYSVRMIQHLITATARRAGLTKRVHPHTYRHSVATFLRNQDVPLDVIQLLLGHADPKTTELYSRLSLATARTAYDRAMGRLTSGEALTTL